VCALLAGVAVACVVIEGIRFAQRYQAIVAYERDPITNPYPTY
jgi:hypothetical protein